MVHPEAEHSLQFKSISEQRKQEVPLTTKGEVQFRHPPALHYSQLGSSYEQRKQELPSKT